MVFVDGEPTDLPADSLGDVGEGVEHVACQQQDVVEIDLEPTVLLRLVLLVDGGELARFETGRRCAVRRSAHARIVLRGDQRDLAPIDFGTHLVHALFRLLLRPDSVEAIQCLGHKRAFVFGDVGERPFADVGPHLAHLTQCGRMERGCAHSTRHLQCVQTLAHLIGRLHRERHCEHPGGIPYPARACVRDTPRDCSRLAGAGDRDDAHRAVHCQRGRALGVIERGEYALR